MSLEKKCFSFLKKLHAQTTTTSSTTSNDPLTYSLRIIRKLLGNILSDPENSKFHVIKLDKPAISKIADSLPKALKYLELAGFELSDRANPKYVFELFEVEGGKSFLDKDIKEGSNFEKLQMAFQVLNRFCVKTLNMEEFVVLRKDGENVEFDPFTSSNFSTTAISLNKVKLSNLDFELEKLKLLRDDLIQQAGIPDRFFVFFENLSEAKAFSTKYNRFSEVASEVQQKEKNLVLLASKSNKEKQAKNQILSTKSYKERELLRSQPVFVRTLLRLILPDKNKSVLQCWFSVSETIADVLETLSSKLARRYKNAKDISFYIYQSPPKRIFESRKTLEDLKLFPLANVYVGLEGKHLEEDAQLMDEKFVEKYKLSSKDRKDYEKIFEYAKDSKQFLTV